MITPIFIACFLILPSSIICEHEMTESRGLIRCGRSPFPMELAAVGRRPPPIARPHSASNDDRQPFVPYKILFLIDDGIEADDLAKLRMATDYVDRRLSKLIQARKLDDVRMTNRRENCDVMCPVPFPEDFVLPCPLIEKPEQTESMKKLNEANYTLVVRVLVRGQGVVVNERFDQWEDGCGGETSAFAASCQLTEEDVDVGPHHGYFVFCVEPSSLHSERSLRALVLHETLHILTPISLSGFPATSHDCEYLDEDCRGHMWKEVKRQALNALGEPVEITAGLAIGPFIQKAAIDHFGCASVEGVELNLDVTNKTTMDFQIDHRHWAQHLFPDEILAPYVTTARFSDLTLSALASHTKWYKVDRIQAEPLISSKPSDEFACDVAYRKSCFEILREQRAAGDGGVKFMRPFCDPGQGPDRVIASHCSPDHQMQLTCVDDISRNECPFLMGTHIYMYDDEACANATSFEPGTLAGHLGASYGPGTICVTTTRVSLWNEPDRTNAVCVQHECQSDKIILKFKPNDIDNPNCHIACTRSLSNRLLSVNWCNSTAQQEVSIICPDYEQVCKEETVTPAASTRMVLTSTTATQSVTTTSTTTAASSNSAMIAPSNGTRIAEIMGIFSYLLPIYETVKAGNQF